jgi:hypothetical protein
MFAMNPSGGYNEVHPSRHSSDFSYQSFDREMAASHGRRNIIQFYQSLAEHLNKAEKLESVCSHIFKLLNWCLNPECMDPLTGSALAIRGFMDLLKAIK